MERIEEISLRVVLVINKRPISNQLLFCRLVITKPDESMLNRHSRENGNPDPRFCEDDAESKDETEKALYPLSGTGTVVPCPLSGIWC